jgi:hypothetical protein
MKVDPRIDRLYDLLPIVYRQKDTEVGEPLRALLQVIAEQTNLVEDDIKQLYDNWFIETCEDWVVPYIADLVGYSVVHEAGEPREVSSERALLRNKILIPRREVANTIRYRRRKGTLALLELLARDVANWPARAMEGYQSLLVSQSLDHLRAASRTVDVRQGDVLDRLDGAFDELTHTANAKRINSRHSIGTRGLTATGLFIWRLNAYSVTRGPAYCLDRVKNHYTFSVLGNNSQLFTKPIEEPEPTHIADEMNVPAEIRRHGFEERTADYYGEGKSLCIWRQDEDKPIPLSRIVAADLTHWTYRPQGDQVAVDPRLGRISFAPRAEPRTGVFVTYHYGFSADVGGGEYERKLRTPAGAEIRRSDSTHPDRNVCYVYLVSQRQYPKAPYFETLNGALQKWASDDPDEAIIQIADSGAYVEQIGINFKREDQRLQIRAGNGHRPVIRLLDWYTNRPDSLGVFGYGQSKSKRDTDANAVDESQESAAEYSPDDAPKEKAQKQEASKPVRAPRLILDGLLVSGRSVEVSGRLAQLLIRHCTLVPGWAIDNKCNPESETEPSLQLTDTNAQVQIENSIVGSIVVSQNEVTTDPISISISDSVLDSTQNALEALSGPEKTFAHADLTIVRSTVFGTIRTHSITLAENSIFNGRIAVVRSQRGCVRFSYVPRGSRTPRRYHCQPDGVEAAAAETLRDTARQLNAPPPTPSAIEAAQKPERERVRPRFNSVRYGTPEYCQLAETCAREIKRGADDESEMGVFHDLFQPQREANLRVRLEEYAPAGIDAGFVFVT